MVSALEIADRSALSDEPKNALLIGWTYSSSYFCNLEPLFGSGQFIFGFRRQQRIFSKMIYRVTKSEKVEVRTEGLGLDLSRLQARYALRIPRIEVLFTIRHTTWAAHRKSGELYRIDWIDCNDSLMSFISSSREGSSVNDSTEFDLKPSSVPYLIPITIEQYIAVQAKRSKDFGFRWRARP